MTVITKPAGKPVIGLLAVLAALAFFFTGCSDTGGEDPTPTVTGVTVNPPFLALVKGAATTFQAAVSGEHNPDTKVIWSVEGNSDPDTKFSDFNKGIFSLGAHETSATLTVRASSTADAKFYGTAQVIVTSPADASGSAGLSVTPASALVAKGGSKTFTATPDDVMWTVSGGKSGTSISTGGNLAVAQDETAEILTVTAVSKTNPAKSGIALVAVGATAYTVTFSAGTGAAAAFTSIYVPPNGVAVMPSVTKQHYDLDCGTQNTTSGWYTDAEYETLWNFSSDRVNRNITLYAKWKLHEYSITYYLNRETQQSSPPGYTAPASYTIESPSITLPTTPTRSGYRFEGWFTSPDFSGSSVTSIPSQNSGGDRVYYAKWTAIGSVSITPSNGWGTSADLTFETPTPASLSLQASTPDSAVITVSGTYTNYTWYVNGEEYTQSNFPQDTVGGNSYTFSKIGRVEGRYSIGCRAKKDSQWYYGAVAIRITN